MSGVGLGIRVLDGRPRAPRERGDFEEEGSPHWFFCRHLRWKQKL